MTASVPTYFRLLPQNDLARLIVRDQRNIGFFEEFLGKPCFRITLAHSPKHRGTLISLGKEKCDIFLPEMAPCQCKFVINYNTCELILRDTSPNRSTRLVFEKKVNQKYSLQGSPRQRVISRVHEVSVFIYQAIFQLEFTTDGTKTTHAEIMSFANIHRAQPGSEERNARKTGSPQKLPDIERIDYEKKKGLGRGHYGKVSLVTALQTGDQFAVKEFYRRGGETAEDHKTRFQNEVELFRAAKHVSASTPDRNVTESLYRESKSVFY
jgi:hypothetical protein